MVPPSAEEGQYQDRVAGPARGLLHLVTPGQPPLGFRLVPGVDGQRGEAVVAREQQLRLANGAGDVERFAIIPRALLALAAALMDLGEDDQGHWEVTALPEAAIHFHRG